jgi:hypothetical protein
MRQSHPVFDRNVAPDAPVWRYFDLAKFSALLQQRALFFSRADLLGDPLEGSLTQAYAVQRDQIIANPPEGRSREEQEAIFRHNAQIGALHPKTIFVSCWHMGDHESMAMWRGYGGGPYGVAIRTTFAALDRALPETFRAGLRNESIYIGKVHYLDYLSSTEHLPHEFNVYGRLMCKSIAYGHEHELRAMFSEPTVYLGQEPNQGYLVPIDLAVLSPTVVISPLAPAWFNDVIASLCSNYHAECSTATSIASARPIY